MKRIFFLGFTVIIFFISSHVAEATDIEVTCNDSGCTPSSVAHFFPATEIWYPQKSLEKVIKVNNQSGVTQTIGARPQNVSTSGAMDEVMGLVIRLGSSNGVIWTGSLHNFYNGGKIPLSVIPNLLSEEYKFDVTMDSAADNQYQGKSTSFDLVLSYVSGPTSTPVPTNTPAPTSTPTPTTGTTSSNSNSSPTNTPALQASTTINTPTPATAGFSRPNTAGNETAGVLGTETTITSTPQSPEILGTQVTNGWKWNIYLNSWVWLVFLLFETILMVEFVYWGNIIGSRYALWGQILFTFISILLSGKIFSDWWMILASGIIGILGIMVIAVKLRPRFSIFSRFIPLQ